MKSFVPKLNILSLILIFSLSLSGCKTIAGLANNLGDKMPVYSGAARCDGYFCFGDNDSPQKTSSKKREVRQVERRAANPNVEAKMPQRTYGNADYQPPMNQQHKYKNPASPQAPRYEMPKPKYSITQGRVTPSMQHKVQPTMQHGMGIAPAQKLENFKLPPIEQYKPGMIPHTPPPGMPDITPPAQSAKDMKFIEMNGMRIPAVDIPKDMRPKQVNKPKKEMISREEMLMGEDVMYQDMEGFPMIPYEGESEDPLGEIDNMDWKKDRPKSPIDRVQQSIDW